MIIDYSYFFSTEYKDWLQSLKTGEKFAVRGDNHFGRESAYDIGIVIRTTQTLIIVEFENGRPERIRRDSGDFIGRNTYRWRIQPVSKEILSFNEKVFLASRVERLIYSFQDLYTGSRDVLRSLDKAALSEIEKSLVDAIGCMDSHGFKNKKGW
jgi:hypothetical protein